MVTVDLVVTVEMFLGLVLKEELEELEVPEVQRELVVKVAVQ